MEDPLGQARRALYTRMVNQSDGLSLSDSALTGLFTRPAVLAISDETAGTLPIRAMNRACRMLLTVNPEAVNEDTNLVNRVADECGFVDVNHFILLFREATGWHPEEWHRRFGRDSMPKSTMEVST